MSLKQIMKAGDFYYKPLEKRFDVFFDRNGKFFFVDIRPGLRVNSPTFDGCTQKASTFLNHKDEWKPYILLSFGTDNVHGEWRHRYRKETPQDAVYGSNFLRARRLEVLKSRAVYKDDYGNKYLVRPLQYDFDEFLKKLKKRRGSKQAVEEALEDRLSGKDTEWITIYDDDRKNTQLIPYNSAIWGLIKTWCEGRRDDVEFVIKKIGAKQKAKKPKRRPV